MARQDAPGPDGRRLRLTGAVGTGAMRGGIAASAAVVAALTFVSAMLGLARDVSIAAVFGAGPDLDAYLVAQGLMNLVLALMAGGVAKAVVPVVARARAQGREREGAHSVGVALTVLTVVLLVGSAGLWLLAEPVVTVLAPGLSRATAQEAVSLTRVVLVAATLVGATNVLAGAVQAQGRFAWSATQGIVFNVVMISAALTLGRRYGVVALAGAFVLGSLARLLVQLPAVRAAGLRLRPSLNLRDPGLREMAALLPPLLVGSALVNVNSLVDRAVGSAGGEGTISALSYGWRLVALSDTLFVAALTTSLYPAFAAAAMPGRGAQLQDLVRRGTGVLLVLLAPVAVVLALCAEPLVTLLFGRGAFDETAVRDTASAVLWYSPALVALALREPAMRASYALGDARTPMVLAGVGVGVNVAGDLTLGLRYGIPGLAASTSLSLLVVAGLSLWRLDRRVSVREVVRSIRSVVTALVPAALVGWSVLRLVPGDLGAASAAIACVAVYVLGLRRLGSRELDELVTTVRRVAGQVVGGRPVRD